MKEFDLKKDSISKLFIGYAVPAMIGICIFSLYTLVDSIFVSRFCGETALSAVEICAPVLSAFSFISIIIGMGANTLIGIKLGENNNKKASSIFTLATALIFFFALLFIFSILLFTEQAAKLLGADETIIAFVCDYLRICGCFAPAFLISGFWSLSMETMGKPLAVMIGNIVTAGGNIFLDYIFIVKLQFGIKGAAFASGLSALISVLIYFAFIVNKNSVLKFSKFKIGFKLIFHMLYNGLSEGLSVISLGIVSYIYNILIMKAAGSYVLANFSISLTIMNFIGSVIIGASQGVNPIISVNFGAKNYSRIRKTLKVFICYEILIAVMVSILFYLFHNPIINLFAAENAELTWSICKAYFPVLLFTPVSVTIISYFTAVNNAGTSAGLSVFRTLIIRMIVIIAAFKIFDLKGIWYSTAIAELISLLLCCFTYEHKKKDNKMKNSLKNFLNSLTKAQRVLLIFSGYFFVFAFIMGMISNFFDNILYLILAIIFCFIDVIIFGTLLILLMPKALKGKKENIKINTCLIAVIMILLCVCFAVLLEGIGLIFSDGDKENIFSSASDIIMILVPPMLSFLGLHYSNQINQENAREEKRLKNLPYLKVKFGLYQGNPVFIINNIADNICVPKILIVNNNKNKIKELEFHPIPLNQEESYIIDTVCNNGDAIELIFKDILENYYSTTFVYSLNSTDVYMEISEPKLVSENDLEDIKSSVKSLSN